MASESRLPWSWVTHHPQEECQGAGQRAGSAATSQASKLQERGQQVALL